MRGAWAVDLEYSLWWLAYQLPDQLQFCNREYRHGAILIQNGVRAGEAGGPDATRWTASVLDSRDKQHNGLWKASRRQYMVELRFRIRNNVFNMQTVPCRRSTIRPLA